MTKKPKTVEYTVADALDNAQAAVTALRSAIEAVAHEANRKAITLLTFDAEAGMAYLHFVAPGCGAVARQLEHVFIDPPFTATTDHNVDGVPLGAEFPAGSQEEALARGATIAAAFA